MNILREPVEGNFPAQSFCLGQLVDSRRHCSELDSQTVAAGSTAAAEESDLPIIATGRCFTKHHFAKFERLVFHLYTGEAAFAIRTFRFVAARKPVRSRFSRPDNYQVCSFERAR